MALFFFALFFIDLTLMLRPSNSIFERFFGFFTGKLFSCLFLKNLCSIVRLCFSLLVLKLQCFFSSRLVFPLFCVCLCAGFVGVRCILVCYFHCSSHFTGFLVWLLSFSARLCSRCPPCSVSCLAFPISLAFAPFVLPCFGFALGLVPFNCFPVLALRP